MEDLEDLILSQIIQNPYYRDKVLVNLRPNFFEDEGNKKLFLKVHSLIVKDKIALLDRKTLALKHKDKEHIERLFELTYPTENINFLIEETEKWGKDNAIKTAIFRAIDVIKEGKETSVIETLVREALSFSFDSDLGLNYFKDIDRRFDFYNMPNERISTGYDMLDYYTNGGLPKGTLTIGAASSGLGKTLAACNISANIIPNGQIGVYLTLELQEELIARRIDSILTKIPYQQIHHQKDEFVKKLAKIKNRNNFHIKYYPPSRACSNNIKVYLKELEIKEKIVPDYLIVDYLQLMKPNHDRSGASSYEKYREISEELRELATELDIPVLSFTQVQRAGYQNSDVGLTHVADSIGIVNTADCVFAQSQTPEEANNNLQTWRIIKNRLGENAKSFAMELDTITLQFKEKPTQEQEEMVQNWRDKKLIYIEEEPESVVEEETEELDVLGEELRKAEEEQNELNKFIIGKVKDASEETVEESLKELS